MRGDVRNLDDARVRRTRQRLQRAFGELVREYGPDAVTIREVAKRARVGRSTFYTHYGDLGELHSEWFNGFMRQEGHGGPPFAFARTFFEHAKSQRSTWKGCARDQSHRIRRRVKADVLAHVRTHIVTDPSSPAVSEAKARMIAGAFCDLLFWWIDTEAPLPPERLERLFREFVGIA